MKCLVVGWIGNVPVRWEREQSRDTVADANSDMFVYHPMVRLDVHPGSLPCPVIELPDGEEVFREAWPFKDYEDVRERWADFILEGP